MKSREELNRFFVSCFNSILRAEERSLESISNGKLTIKEIHFIEAVFKAQAVGENCFSTIANFLGVTTGTLTTSFLRLERKGYLKKEQDKLDKRIYFIVPTRLAEMVNREHTAFHEKIVDEVMCMIPENEMDTLLDTLKILNDFFSQFKDEPGKTDT